MLSTRPAFSGFSATDIEAERSFYADVLGVDVEDANGALMLKLGGGQRVYVYPKPNHEPASYTVLNFEVDDLEAAVDDLVGHGVQLERYEGLDQDARGIARDTGGPAIAWFQDPAGNILSLVQRG